MRYCELLDIYIKNSGLPLREIAKRCNEQGGLSIDYSYLSKLRNGKRSPASDRVNGVIANVLNGDRNELIAAAYREKIPPEILKKLAKSS